MYTYNLKLDNFMKILEVNFHMQQRWIPFTCYRRIDSSFQWGIQMYPKSMMVSTCANSGCLRDPEM